ncbi:hypothetical protein BDZ89DRAFT_391173 [Hymenopellis radicata]|nr:hypothetical protein BDZ89DRAFT_391173 [Hymenopellis radicata]
MRTSKPFSCGGKSQAAIVAVHSPRKDHVAMCIVLPPDNICDKLHRSRWSSLMPSEYAIHRSLLFAVFLVLRYIRMRTRILDEYD